MAKLLSVKFVSNDIDKALNSLMKEIDPKKWPQKKNGIVNKGLKASANEVLPTVWSNMRVGSTGRNRMFTSVKRVRGGGWRISTPRRNELDLQTVEESKGAKNKKGYYPASMEFGFKHHKSKKMIEGDHALRDAMNTDRPYAIQTAATYYEKAMEKMIKKSLGVKKKRSLQNLKK
jgi:hypothetical protein